MKASIGTVNSAIALMKGEILRHKLELLQRYPRDLLVHDREMLVRAAVPGAKIAWMVGHCHTHLVVLGLHAEENGNVAYLTNLSNDDRFYLLEVSRDGKPTLKEVDRKEFAALSLTPVPYSREGDDRNFWLYRSGARIGHCSINMSWPQAGATAAAQITPVVGVSGGDHAALELWCSRACASLAQSLFVRQTVKWLAPVPAEQREAA